MPLHRIVSRDDWLAAGRDLPKLQAYARSMGWSLPWYSTPDDFDFDYQAAFTP